MNKYFSILIIFVLSLSLVLAHEGELAEEVDGKIVNLDFLPSEPKAGSSTILSFDVEDSQGKKITHIDGFLDIKKDGETLVNDYELHSHGNQFSMTYKFLEEGKYTATLTVQPSEDYENEKFDPVSVIFYITIEEKEENKNMIYVLGAILALGIITVLIFSLKPRK